MRSGFIEIDEYLIYALRDAVSRSAARLEDIMDNWCGLSFDFILYYDPLL